MDEAEADVLAFMSFAKDHRPKIHSTDEIGKAQYVGSGIFCRARAKVSPVASPGAQLAS
jgi:hypothetical protein